jgi:hypothetical protein
MDYVSLTELEWRDLFAIPDRAFHDGLTNSRFSRNGSKGQREVKISWFLCWVFCDSCGNRRFFRTAAAIRAAWEGYVSYNEADLPEMRRQRYKDL